MSDPSCSSAPSIGSIGSIVSDTYNDRSKGFLPTVTGSNAELDRFLRVVTNRNTFGTRLNVRTFGCRQPRDIPQFVHRPHGLEWNERDQPSILWRGEIPLRPEAIIPVRNHPKVGSILYFGANHQSRLPSDDVRRLEHSLLGRVMDMPRKAPREDLHVEILSRRPSDRDVADIVGIYVDRYTTYLTPFTEESVRGMAAGSQVVVVRDAHGRIASICVSEIAHIPVPNAPPIHFVEISDAATRKDCEGQGMYTAAKAESIRFIRQANPDAVITTEARANSIGVLRSNVNLGMHVAGRQLAHCVISAKSNEDVAQTSRYGNLVVFYVP